MKKPEIRFPSFSPHDEKPVVTRWWWIRHAPVLNGDGRLYGQEDLDCDVSDIPRYEALARYLPEDAVWVVTNLVRTRKTAQAIWAAHPALSRTSPVPEEVPELAEQFFGHWQGLTWAEMQARDAQAYATFWENPSGNAPPGGESFADVIDRVSHAVNALTAKHTGRDIICVAHGGSIRGALVQALDLHHARGLSLSIDNITVTRMEHMGQDVPNDTAQTWRVSGMNMVI